MKKFKLSESVQFHNNDNGEQYIIYAGRVLKLGSIHLKILESIKEEYKTIDEIIKSLGININVENKDALNETRNKLNVLLKELYGLGIIQIGDQPDLYDLKQMFKVGETFLHYRIVSLLSLDDPFVQVYKVQDLNDSLSFVLKIFSQSIESKDSRVIKAYTLFCQEFENLSKLQNNTSVYKLIEYDTRCDVPYGILEFIDGKTLTEIIDDEISSKEKLKIITQMLHSMSYVHDNDIIHGDLHTRNFMIDNFQNVKIIDFGFSYNLKEDLEKQILVKGGQPRFTAPERVNMHDYKFSNIPSNKRSEVYQLGLISYRLLNGSIPFEGETWQEMAKSILAFKFSTDDFDIQRDLANILVKALDINPKIRFGSATEMYNEWTKCYQ